MPRRGLFVTLEGGDGVGKSTHARRLEQRLVERGEEVVRTREPGGTLLGAQIRELVLHGDHVDARAEALLYAADRAHHIATVVRPALERGAVVIQDRYLDSSIAYQGAARDLGADEVRELSLWATRGLLPDLTILLDLDPAEGNRRMGAGRAKLDRLESEGASFHERVRAEFLQLAAAEPERFLVVDASQARPRVSAEIDDAIRALLDERDREGRSGEDAGAEADARPRFATGRRARRRAHSDAEAIRLPAETPAARTVHAPDAPIPGPGLHTASLPTVTGDASSRDGAGGAAPRPAPHGGA